MVVVAYLFSGPQNVLQNLYPNTLWYVSIQAVFSGKQVKQEKNQLCKKTQMNE